MYTSAYPYQPTHIYYNNYPNSLQPYYYPQSISIISDQNNQTYSPTKKSPQPVSFNQKYTNMDVQQKQFFKYEDLQEKINKFSQMFQISFVEVKTLLSENICLCCMKKIFENKQNNKFIQLDHEREDNAELLCKKNPQEQTSNKIFNINSSQDDNIDNGGICKNASILFNYHLKCDEDKQSQNSEGKELFLLSNNTKLENISIEVNEKLKNEKMDFLNETIYSDSNQQSYSLQISGDKQKIISQQKILKKNQKCNIQEKLLNFKLKDNVHNKKEQSISQDQQTHNKTVSYSIIKKSIQKKERDFIMLKRNKIPLINNKQICHLNTQEFVSYQNESNKNEIQSQINQQQCDQLISSVSYCQFNNSRASNSFDKLNKQNFNDQTMQSNKQIQNDSNNTKNLLKGFRRVVFKNYGTNKEFMAGFNKYFDSFSLNNEFILKLFSDSPYSVYFIEFLSTDPSWWMKEARIKDIESQQEFFEICRKRKFTQIRTKRKKFTRPKLY